MTNPDFKPDLTPEQMEMLGVLGHKGSQYSDADPKEHNFFKVKASMEAWPDKWHNPEHPKGWYEWYHGYVNGKRTSDDERQMKRWVSFKARHLAQLKKADPTLQDLSIQPRRRQALLNWGIAPGIKIEEELSARKNKYLEKIAMDPISMALVHAGGVHLAQNMAMKQALKSRALAKHVANGFSAGVKGVVDTSRTGKVKEFAAGALLPEINALHRSAHSAGQSLAPHLAKMTPRQKAGLHMMVSGRSELAIRKGLHKDPAIGLAYEKIRHSHGLPDIKSLSGRADTIAKKTPLVNNVLRNIHKGSAEGAHFKPGKLHATSGVAGSLAASIADPVMGGLNTVKSLAQSQKIKSTSLGGKLIHKVHDLFVNQPFKKGLHGKTKPGKIREAINDAALGPVNTQLKNIGSIGKKD